MEDPFVSQAGRSREALTASDDHLQPPAGFRDSAGFRSSYGDQSFDSGQPLNNNFAEYDDPNNAHHDVPLEKDEQGPLDPSSPLDLHSHRGAGKRRRPWVLVLAAVALIALIIVAVIVPVYFTVIKPHNDKSASSASSASSSASRSGSSTGAAPAPSGTASNSALTGGDGSTITTDTGSTFVYRNSFGGFWVSDPNNPYNSNAQAQSWSPPLNQSWTWGVDIVRGVNLGGWLVPEPFIVPALFERYQNTSTPVIDEWTLSQAMAADTANGGLNQLEDHYNTFITEEDFAQIAAAGLNWVRLPIPFWAIQTYPGEPFLEGVCWKYALKAFAWARKYGLRVNVDLHALPGSQNGYNHSGKQGQVDFLNGVMGLANAQRGLDYMRVIVEFITQKEYSNLVPLFGVANEVLVKTIGMDVMGDFYLLMHDTLRNVTGYGTGNGPYLSIHDGFEPLSTWADFLPGRDRMAMDTHPYLCFTNQDSTPLSGQLQKPCTTWANSLNTSWSTFGVTTAGEWSLAINDCGYWVNGIGKGTRWEGTMVGYSGPTGNDPNGCSDWNNWQAWDQTTKSDFQQFALATMDALQNWFFWTWKIGNSTVLGTVGAPFWSYSLGLEQGWMPTDPRAAVGVCGGGSPASPLQPIMTGGPGAGDFSQSVIAANPWPPTTLGPGGYTATLLPTYTATGPIPTLPMPTFTNSAAAALSTDDGWFDSADTAPMHTPVAGCTYPDAWDAVDVDVPPLCSASAQRRVRNVVAPPKRTPHPHV